MRINRPKGQRKKTCSKCDSILDDSRIGKYRYCKRCHAEHMRKNRLRHSELLPEAKKKANCRSYTNVVLKRGNIVKEDCYNCGNDNTQVHHSDYDKPKEVRWVCRPCHLELHVDLELENKINAMPPSTYTSNPIKEPIKIRA